MKNYMIHVCDDTGVRVYSKTISARSFNEAEIAAFKWANDVEASEGWFTCYKIEDIN